MDENRYVAHHKSVTVQPLVDTNFGWYSEVGIENMTGEVLCVMRPDGTITEIAPMWMGNPLGSRVNVKFITRVGFKKPSLSRVGEIDTSDKQIQHTVVIDFQRLIFGPIHVAEAGLMLARKCDEEALRNQNFMDPEYRNKLAVRRIEEDLRAGCNSPIVIYTNCHNPDINVLYVSVNKRIVGVPVRHDPTARECLMFAFNKGASHNLFTVNGVDWSKLDVTVEVFGTESWIYGTNSTKVHKKIQELQNEEVNKLSLEETKSRISEATAELQSKVENKEKELEVAKRELELTKRELANTKLELDRANDTYKASYEQQVLAFKLAQQQQENELLKQKRQLVQEQMLSNMEHTSQKNKADIEVARAKVEKEQLSVQSAKSSTLGTIVKAAAIIVPAVIGAIIYFSKTSSSEAALAQAGPIGLPLLAVGAIGSSIKKVGSSIVSGMKNVANNICDKVKGLWTKIKSWF